MAVLLGGLLLSWSGAHRLR